MKKILLATAFALTVSFANAQLKYGLKAGVNFANVTVNGSDYSLSPSSVTSFHLTGFVDIGLNENFSFQPGISFQGKGFKSKEEEDGFYVKEKADYSYVEIPLNAVYSLPAGSQGSVFFGAGPYVSFGLFGKYKIDDNLSSEDRKIVEEFLGQELKDRDVKFGNKVGDDLSPIDFGLNFMLGYRLNSGLLLNAGYGLGLANVMPKDQREGDSKLKNKLFSISVGYSF